MSGSIEPIGPTDHALGRANAPLALIEYGDYECPHCARAHFEVAEVLRRVGDDLRYAFRHFPLTRIHPHALLAAQAAESAGSEGRFWPMHSILFENQRSLELVELVVWAETLGVDPFRFTRELRAGLHIPKIENDFRTGVLSGVHETPTFFLNGVRIDGAWDAESLTDAIRRVSPGGPPVAARRSRPPAHR